MEGPELSRPRVRTARNRYKKKDVENEPGGEQGSDSSLISIGSADDIPLTSQDSLPSVAIKVAEERFTFNSRMQHLIFYFCYVISVPNLLMFVKFTTDEVEPSYFHYMVTFTVVGLPLLYMEMAMGQYTGSGILHFGKLVPFFHGLGWSMLLISIHQSLTNMAHVSDCMYYFMMSFGHLTFTQCAADLDIGNVTCLDSDMVKECTEEGACQPSVYAATLFHSEFVDSRDYDFTKGIGPLIFGRTVCNVVSWVATGIVVNMGIARFIKVLKVNVIIICALLMAILVYVLLQSLDVGQRIDTDIGAMFRIEGGTLSDLDTWMMAVSHTVKLVGAGSVGHMLCGSYMRPKAPSDLDAILFLIMHYLVFIVAAMFTHTVVGFHTAKMNVAFEETHVENYLFTAIPQGLSLMPIPNLLCLMYFSMLVLIGVSSQVVQMAVIVNTMLDFMPKIKTYHSYLTGFISLASMVLASAFLTHAGYSLDHFLEINFFQDFRITILIVELCCMHYLYGAQRFADDIHFLLGTQPTMFFKLSWLVLPLVFAYTFNRTSHKHFDHLEKIVMGVLLVLGYYFIFSLPIIIGAVYKCIKFLQYRNLVGVLMPEETWGPTDPHERLMRRIYNPRFETRSRRRDHSCKHRCMKGSKVLADICSKEKAARYQVTGVESDYEL